MGKKNGKKDDKKKENVIKSLGKCSNFKDLEKFLKSRDNDHITHVLDKALLKPTTFDNLLKLMEKENKRIGSSDFKDKSRIRAHINYRKTSGWVFKEEEDSVQLVDLTA